MRALPEYRGGREAWVAFLWIYSARFSRTVNQKVLP